MVLFNDDGSIQRIIKIGPTGNASACDIPPGVWHSVVCLESKSVFLEAKPGPYQPIEADDFALWAPREGGPGAMNYLEQLERKIAADSLTVEK